MSTWNYALSLREQFPLYQFFPSDLTSRNAYLLTVIMRVFLTCAFRLLPTQKGRAFCQNTEVPLGTLTTTEVSATCQSMLLKALVSTAITAPAKPYKTHARKTLPDLILTQLMLVCTLFAVLRIYIYLKYFAVSSVFPTPSSTFGQTF